MASGLNAWFLQRLSGIYIAAFLVYLLVLALTGAPISHIALREWLANDLHAVLLLFFAAALLQHAWIGVRDIAIDYLRPDSLRVLVMTAIGIGLLGLAIWAVLIVLGR